MSQNVYYIMTDNYDKLIIPFGKHRNKSVAWVCENDRRYMGWFLTKIDDPLWNYHFRACRDGKSYVPDTKLCLLLFGDVVAIYCHSPPDVPFGCYFNHHWKYWLIHEKDFGELVMMTDNPVGMDHDTERIINVLNPMEVII